NGTYQVTVRTPRPAASGDAERIEAEQAVSEGERLRYKGTATSLTEAVKQFERATSIWHNLHDDFEEAIGLYGLGWSYNPLGEYQKAAASFRRALELARSLNDHYVEALGLSGIGWSLLYLGDTEQALTHFTTSLALRQAVRDSRGEGITLFGIG